MRKLIYSFFAAIIFLNIAIPAFSSDISGFEVINTTANSITLKYISGYTGDKVISVNGNADVTVLLPQFKNAFQEYSPSFAYPVYNSHVNLIVPSEKGFKITEFRTVTHVIKNYNFSNLPEYLLQTNPELAASNSENFLSKNEFQPYSFEYSGIARNQHIAVLKISAAKFNINTKSLSIIDTAYITIKFDLSEAVYSSVPTYFNAISVINYEMGSNWVSSSNLKKSDKETLQSPDPTISSLSSGLWGRIVIEKEGIYKLDASDLQSIGIPSTPAAAKTLKIFGKGGKPLSEIVSDGLNNKMDEQEIIVKTKADGSIESVIFYAAGTSGFEKRNGKISHYKNFYSDNNYYLITWGGNDGKRATALSNPSGDIIYRPSSYKARYFMEEDIVNPFTPGAGRDWFGRSFFSSPLPPVLLNDLDRSGEITYYFALAQKAEKTGTFTIFENNKQIGTMVIPSSIGYVQAFRTFKEIKIPASDIASDNRSNIKLQFQNSQFSAAGYFDYYEITYPRNFFAADNSIDFITEKGLNGLTEFNMNGFSGEIYGFDVSDVKSPKLLTNKAVTGGMYSFVSNLDDTKFNRYYISSLLKKPKLEIIEINALRDNMDNAPIVVITHPDLYESALKFKEYREAASGKKVVVYKTNNIYNEYSSSLTDVTAIRDFLIDINNRWDVKPEYVVLWGDGHYDYRNISTNKKNYIPAYQTYRYDLDSFNEINEGYATDDYYALIAGDDLMTDINFGRVPIDNPDLGFWIVDKIKHYETSSSKDIWRSNIIMIADDGPSEGTSYEPDHTNQSENLQKNYISLYKPDLQYDKIYLAEYPVIYAGTGRTKPAVTEDMLTKINTTGGVLLNWVGHGNPRVWAHEVILNRDVTIPKMRNLDKLFFLTAATCDFGRFDDPEVRSGAEDMFLSKNGGAIGVLAASRVVFSPDNAFMAYAFYTKLMTRNPLTGQYPSIGEVIRSLKQTFTSVNDRKYILLGDPTMRLLMPDYKINLTSINDTLLSGNQSTISLPALSKVKLNGYITKPMSNETDESFNGTVVVTLRDGDMNMSVKEVFLNEIKPAINFTKLGGSLNRSSYNVVNGRFEAEFIIPKDISFSDSFGKLFLYASSTDDHFASGNYDKIKISGFSNVDKQDTTPPEIKIYLDGRKFVSGELVTSNPLLIVDLYDESGINTTGLGIGHKIEAWIDNSSVSIDLTDKFNSSLTDSHIGTVEDYLFGLSSGEHTIKIRAWDVFNNYAIAETVFRIPENGDGGLITNIFNYPNPFNEGTVFEFRHNALPPFDVKIDIYTINGILIRNINGTLNSLHTSQIEWNGLDNNGKRIADGIYMYNVSIRHETGTVLGRGKLVKIGN